MNSAARSRHLAMKELRAATPVWLSAAAAIILAAATGRTELALPALVVYITAATGIGALSFGHEYGHGTLGVLLALPVARSQLMIVKAGVTAGLLGALWLIAVSALLVGPDLPAREWNPALILIAPVLAGLCLAPSFTLLCRSTLAGMVLSVAAPACLLVSTELVTGLVHGFTGTASRAAVEFRNTIAIAGFVAMCAGGLAAMWPLVRRLQLVDGRGRGIDLALSRASTRVGVPQTRHPLRQLVRKEIRIQQGVLAVSALFLVLALSVRWLARDLAWEMILSAVCTIHGGVIALLAGASATAEERQMGTHDAQLLLPVRASTQWTVKAGIALVCALVLGLGLPLALVAVFGETGLRALGQLVRIETAAAIVAMTVAGLYVSSLVSGSLRAFLYTLAVVAGAILALNVLTRTMAQPLADSVASGLMRYIGPTAARDVATIRSAIPGLTLLAIAGLLGLVLRLAFENHRFADRGATRVLRHVVLILAAFTVAQTCVQVLWRIGFWR